MLKYFLILLLTFTSTYSFAVEEKNKTQNESSDDDIRDYFTDEDGNILEPYKIPSLKATISNWKILVGNIDERKVCYAVSKPFAKVGNHKETRDAYLMVVYWNKKRQDINISMGFNFKSGSLVRISVDGKQYSANTDGTIAIPGQNNIDGQIVKSMVYAKRLMVKGDSKIGTYAVDAYDIENFQSVYSKLIELCDFM